MYKLASYIYVLDRQIAKKDERKKGNLKVN